MGLSHEKLPAGSQGIDAHDALRDVPLEARAAARRRGGGGGESGRRGGDGGGSGGSLRPPPVKLGTVVPLLGLVQAARQMVDY